MSREIPRWLGRAILTLYTPGWLWPEHARLGIDPQGATAICVRRFGQIAWFEN